MDRQTYNNECCFSQYFDFFGRDSGQRDSLADAFWHSDYYRISYGDRSRGYYAVYKLLSACRTCDYHFRFNHWFVVYL